MLNRSDIRQETIKKTFDKGVSLYESGYVYRLEKETYVELGNRVTEVMASVRGSRGNVYEVNLKIDEPRGEITYSHCGCDEFYSYAGMCKHCVAAALEFVADQEKKVVIQQPARGAYGRQMVSVKKPTTPELVKVMAKYKVLEKNRFIPDSGLGKVKIEPHLTLQYGMAQVEFKIGITQMYVLKNLAEFAGAVKSGASIKYGQKLEFVHSMEAFTEESRPFVRFILREIEKYYFDTKEVYRNHRPNFRNWDLGQDSFDLLMEIVGQDGLMADMEGLPLGKWKVEEKKYKEILTITGGKEGAQLHGEYISMYVGLEYFYFFKDKIIYRGKREDVADVEEFLLFLSRGQGGFIAKDDLPAFSRTMLPILEQHFEVRMEEFDPNNYLPQSVRFEVYLDAPEKDVISCKVFAIYGVGEREERYPLFPETNQMGMRDALEEMKMSHLVESYFQGYEENLGALVLKQDEGKLYELLSDGIARFQGVGSVFVSDEIKNIRIMSAPKVSVGVSLSGDLLELELNSKELPTDQLVEILSRYDKKKKFYRLKNGNFIDLDEDGFAILSDLKQGLSLSDAKLRTGVASIPKFRALYLDEKLKEQHGLSIAKDHEFKALIRNMKTIEDNDFEIPASLEQVVRDYQKKGFLWIKTLQYNGFGGILADDMGLGKTLQVISFLLAEHLEAKPDDNRRSLIVCPASLVYNWKSELERFAPKLPVVMVIGTAKEREALISKSSCRDILVTSYDLLKRDIDCYENIAFHCQVIDEAQFIKNHATMAAKAVKQIDAGFRLALTGTPVENRLSELWSIFDYLMHGFLYGYETFRDELEIPIVQNHDEEAIGRLQKMIRPFVLRRLKRDVLTDLPDKIEENMHALMEEEQQKLYDSHVQRIQMFLDKQSDEEFIKSRFQVLAEITRLRQLCCDPALLYSNYEGNSAKLEMCMELIKNAISGGHKILLFSQFTGMLDRIQDNLQKEHISFYSLTGATPKEKRAKMVEEFNQNDVSVFCISLKAGGTGLNLTAADIVIHYDPWWNVAVQNQATDRAHRIGQKNVVTVYKLIAKGSIEEKIVQLQDKKRELAEQVLDSETLAYPSFSKEDLLSLL